MASIKLKGDTSGEVIISAPSVAGNTTLTLPATSSTLATQNALGVRNLIINGDMRIAQRGTSLTGMTNSSGVSYQTVDRFLFGGSGSPFGTWTQSQDTDVPTGQGFANSFKMQCTTSSTDDGQLLFQHRIEGQNLQHIKKGTSNAESLTLSFWVKSNKTGTYIAELNDKDNTRQISYAYTIDSSDTWEKKTITFAGDTTGTLDNDNNRSLDVILYLKASSSASSGTLNTSWASTVQANRAVGQVNLADSTANYINITGVQLETGTTATPFEHRPYDMELAMCQRYFSTSYGNNPVGTNTWDGTFAGRNYDTTTRGENTSSMMFPVQMRTSPTLAAYSKAGTSGKGTTGSTSLDLSSTEVNCTIRGSATGIRGVIMTVAGPHFYQFHFTASAEL